MTPLSPQVGTDIRLQPMQIDDIDTVLAIERLSFSTPWSRAMFVTELANTKMSRLLIARARPYRQQLATGLNAVSSVISEQSTDEPVAVRGTGNTPGTIVGHLAFRIIIDEMHIILVAVHPEWRRRSIARQMLEHAMAQARDAACRKATLEVRASNIAAQRLYFQLGFAPVGTRRRYYRRPSEDALILWRDPL